MRSGLVVLALLTACCTLGRADSLTPCTPGTLASYYANFGSSGCSIGSVSFSNFTDLLVSNPATAIDAAAVMVVPILNSISPGFQFIPNVTANAGEVFESHFGYVLGLIGGAPVVARLSMAGSSASGDGVTTVVEELCTGGQIPSGGSCGGQNSPDAMIVFDIGIDASLADVRDVGPLSTLGVATDIVVDGGTGGSAALGSATNQFTVVPEPASLVSFATALASMWLLSRRRSQ